MPTEKPPWPFSSRAGWRWTCATWAGILTPASTSSSASAGSPCPRWSSTSASSSASARTATRSTPSSASERPLVPLAVARRGGGAAMEQEAHDLIDEREGQAHREPRQRDPQSRGIATRGVDGEGERVTAGGPEHDGEERRRRRPEDPEQ